MRHSSLGFALLLAVAGVFPSFSFPVDGPTTAAKQQFEAGNYATAIADLQAILTKQTTSAEANYWLGRSYYELHDYDKAIEAGEQSIKFDPANSLYHQWLGREYGGKADRDRSFFMARKTKKEFEDAVKFNPKNLSARRDLEEFYLDAPWILGGSKEAAMDQVNAIAAVDAVEGHLARAVYWRDAKKLDLAEGEYQWVLRMKPGRIDPYLEVTGFYQHQANATKMEEAIEAAAQVNSSDLRLSYYRGVADVIGATRLNEGEPYLKSYLASAPDRSDWPSHAATREWLGELYEKMGRRMEAGEQYRAALQLDPKSKTAREKLQNLEKIPH